MKTTVALLFGGKGEEHAVSCRSAAAVLSHISPKKYTVVPIGIDRDGNFFIYKGDREAIGRTDLYKRTGETVKTFPVRIGAERGFLTETGVLPVEVAFPVLHGRGGEDGEVQGLLAAAGIPFVGCDAVASAACFDKELAKRAVAAAGVKVARGVCLSGNESTAEAEMRVYSEFSADAPVFVKPARQGSSVGASLAKCKSDFAKSYDIARAFGRVMVEEYIENKAELEIALLQRGGELLFAGPGRIRSASELYSFGEKYGGGAEVEKRPRLAEAVKARVLANARRAAVALSLRDLARIDFFLTDEGEVLFNEVNTLPGFTETSLYPALWEAEGLCFSALIDHLIGEALARPA